MPGVSSLVPLIRPVYLPRTSSYKFTHLHSPPSRLVCFHFLHLWRVKGGHQEKKHSSQVEKGPHQLRCLSPRLPPGKQSSAHVWHKAPDPGKQTTRAGADFGKLGVPSGCRQRNDGERVADTPHMSGSVMASSQDTVHQRSKVSQAVYKHRQTQLIHLQPLRPQRSKERLAPFGLHICHGTDQVLLCLHEQWIAKESLEELPWCGNSLKASSLTDDKRRLSTCEKMRASVLG